MIPPPLAMGDTSKDFGHTNGRPASAAFAHASQAGMNFPRTTVMN